MAFAGESNPEAAAALRTLRFLSFRPGPACAEAPQGEVALEFLKAGHRRATYRARIGGRPAIVKVSFHSFGRFKLARERRRLLAMKRLGLPAPSVLGEGRPSSGRFALILEDVAGPPFQEAWLAAPDAATRRELLLRLAESLRDLHRSGVEHRDPHPRNLLAGLQGVLWLDAAALRFRPGGGPLPPGRALRNLALVHSAFGIAAGAGGREWLRALRAYLGPGEGRRRRHAWAREVLRLSARFRKRFLRKRARRCLRANRDFVQVRLPGRRAAARRGETAGPTWKRFLESPDSFFEGALILKDGRSTRAARVLWDGRPAFLKRYQRPGILHRFKYLFRRSRAFRGWVAGHALELGSVPAPRPLAVLEVRRRWLPCFSYLVTEWVEGETSDRALNSVPSATRDALVQSLTAALARLHALGVRHRDLKPQNVFFETTRGGISLVDFDGVRFPLSLSAAARRRDLERWLRDLPAGEAPAIVRISYQHDYKLAEMGFPRQVPTRPCLPGRFAYNTSP